MAMLASGYTLRAPSVADLDGLAALLVAHERARAGSANADVAGLRTWIESVWATTGFVVARDARVAIAPSGEIAGYITLWRAEEASGHMVASPRLLPPYEGLGLDIALLRWAASLAREKASALAPEVHAALNSWVDGPDPRAEEMLTGEGFTLAQRHLHMEITLTEEPPAPVWPAGVAPRPFVAERDERAVYDLMTTAIRGSSG